MNIGAPEHRSIFVIIWKWKSVTEVVGASIFGNYY